MLNKLIVAAAVTAAFATVSFAQSAVSPSTPATPAVKAAAAAPAAEKKVEAPKVAAKAEVKKEEAGKTEVAKDGGKDAVKPAAKTHKHVPKGDKVQKGDKTDDQAPVAKPASK